MIGEEPASLELYIHQGSTFEATINFKDSDGNALSLSGSTFSGQIRRTKESTAVAETFDMTVSGSSLTIRIPHTRTALLTAGRDRFAPEACYWFDIDWNQPSGTRRTPLAGKVFVVREVTR
jgi:hypothetical protein